MLFLIELAFPLLQPPDDIVELRRLPATTASVLVASVVCSNKSTGGSPP
jgi:hypothetical protein